MEQQKVKVEAHNLRRLWHWVQNSTPKAETYQGLRAASKELGKILGAAIDENGLPGIPRDLPVEGQVECLFSEGARIGFRNALLQAISGQNHPQHQPAPFGSIEYLILPIADALGIGMDLRHHCNMLLGTELN